MLGEAGSRVTVVSLPARGRPPQAAARRAGLEFVEKLLPTKLTSTDTTERNAGMLRVTHHRIAWSTRLELTRWPVVGRQQETDVPMGATWTSSGCCICGWARPWPHPWLGVRSDGDLEVLARRLIAAQAQADPKPAFVWP